jgi:hypothetical protein
MKSVRLVALAAFVVLSIAVALADSIDPVVRTGGGTGSVAITSPIFTMVTPTGNSPTDGTPCVLIQGSTSTQAPECVFSNDIGDGTTIHELVFVASKADFSGTLSCELMTKFGGPSPYFKHCAAMQAGVVEFFGGPGIPFGDEFSLGFGDFNHNATFQVTAIPEPGTLALFMGGIGAWLVRRKSRSR